jgi:arsenical pump membrane protein
MRFRGSFLFAALGLACAGIACAVRPVYAGSAAGQAYPAFVLVAGLLLIGFVAEDEGLFALAGDRLAKIAPRPLALFCGATIMIGLVTGTLNLDTAVAFLTPVLVYAGRNGAGGDAMLYGCLMLANAGSLLLPGANLTNLILLGQLHLAGDKFLAKTWLAALAALVVTAVVVAVAERQSLRRRRDQLPEPPESEPDHAVRLGYEQLPGLAAILASTLVVLVFRDPAGLVIAIGALAATVHVARHPAKLTDALAVLGLPLLIGLFGIAVGLGALGRAWSGPAALLAHLDSTGTAVLAAASAVVVNNLPAASLLAARATQNHPFSLLVGLNLGPNLAVTGSLAWLLWLRAARRAGASPSLARASRIGAVAVPLSMAAALAGLAVTGAR